MNFKSGFVTIIGRPNVGKSTLVNYLIGEKISITSPRPQTTRNSIKAIYTEDKGQIIFVDTPGIYKTKNDLDKFMVNQAYKSLEGIDVIIFMLDATDSFKKGDQIIYNQIKNSSNPFLVVLNKIDKVKKKELPNILKEYNKRIEENIVPISSKTGRNVKNLINEIFDFLPEGPQYYPDDMITDQIEQFIIAEMIREKTFYLLREEVPFGIAVVIEEMKERKDKTMYIRANIYVEKKSHKGIIIGKNGKMLKKIGTRARKDIEKLLQQKVYLDLWVKIEKDWRDDENLLKRMGYKG
ncbi:MAG TPA: GTPase Era [Halanaerobiales bacterium]|nr:GTPase Era [Halanaerobiales bacterium]